MATKEEIKKSLASIIAKNKLEKITVLKASKVSHNGSAPKNQSRVEKNFQKIFWGYKNSLSKTIPKNQ